MTRLTLVRKWQSSTSTAGVLSVATLLNGFTLEDALRAPGIKVTGAACIGPGEYDVVLTASDRFKRGTLWSPRQDHALPMLRNVPGFEGIRIPAGNRDTNTTGCILAGTELVVNGVLKAPTSHAIESVGLVRSRLALESVLALLEEPARILIVNSSQLVPIEAA
jgi:hypothetical protein